MYFAPLVYLFTSVEVDFWKDQNLVPLTLLLCTMMANVQTIIFISIRMEN